jgi:HD-GYP domain-containing protein (c-di-GMP phosphodiesterase class II)
MKTTTALVAETGENRFISSHSHVQSVEHGRYRVFLPNGHVVLLDARNDILKTFEIILKEKDPFTYEHSIRVTDISVQIAQEFGMNTIDQKNIFQAALLHDVGKLSIPKLILLKPGGLTKEEWDVVYKHPVVSEMIVGQLPFFTSILPAIRHHHERYDGTGYPDRLKAKDIPLNARIIALADAFDAMTTKRPYRNAMPFQKALSIICKESSKQFDPFVVKAFLNIAYRQN